MGDFNSNITSRFKIYNRPLYGTTKINTCCDSNNLFTQGTKSHIPFDHILTSWRDANPTIVHKPTPPASDHLPITRTIKLLQSGGMKDINYKKYMKYKNKYIQLKNNI